MQLSAENLPGSKSAYCFKFAAPPIGCVLRPKSVSTHSVGCVTLVPAGGASSRLPTMPLAIENLADLALRRFLGPGIGFSDSTSSSVLSSHPTAPPTRELLERIMRSPLLLLLPGSHY